MKNESEIQDEEESEVVEEDLDDSVVAEEHAQDSIKKLKDKLKASETKTKEYLDGWQRSQADFANLRKKDEEAKVEFVKYATQSIVEELIPVLDSFNIAITSGHKETEPVYKQLLSVLKGRGLEELEPLGETFDPRLHEAIATEPSEEDEKILKVLQKGYVLNGKIIRPAKVIIGQNNG